MSAGLRLLSCPGGGRNLPTSACPESKQPYPREGSSDMVDVAVAVLVTPYSAGIEVMGWAGRWFSLR
jgi:hypothetical protein